MVNSKVRSLFCYTRWFPHAIACYMVYSVNFDISGSGSTYPFNGLGTAQSEA